MYDLCAFASENCNTSLVKDGKMSFFKLWWWLMLILLLAEMDSPRLGWLLTISL